MKSQELSRLLFREQIEPMMERRFPGIRYGAGSFGMCSENLGLDDEVSRDHEWGPRVTLYLSDEDFGRLEGEVEKALAETLPPVFHGIDMMWRQDGVDIHDTTKKALYHVYVNTLSRRLGFCGGSLPLKDEDWLKVSEQHLLEFTSGTVHRDDYGELAKARQTLAFYPDSVLRFLLMCEWNALGGDWFPIGRIGSRGDRLGLKIQAARVASHMMQIAFHVSRRYSTYKKWFGTLFCNLPISGELGPVLEEMLREDGWERIEELIGEASGILLAHQNRLGITREIALKADRVDNGRHHIKYGFWDIGGALKENMPGPLLGILDSQVFWLDERNLILWNHETGKWPLFLAENKQPPE
jgi:hypothetical protein